MNFVCSLKVSRSKRKTYIVIRFFGQKISVLMLCDQVDDRHQRFAILHGNIVCGLREQFGAFLVPFTILWRQTGGVRLIAQFGRFFRLILELLFVLLVLLFVNMFFDVVFEVVLCDREERD